MEYQLPSKWQEDIESRILDTVRDLAVKVGLTPPESQAG
jgi:hypothetical protein